MQDVFLQIIFSVAMHKTITLIIFHFFPIFLFAQSSAWGYKGYSGGMFVHTGYVQSKSFSVYDEKDNEIKTQIKGATFGLGGKMSVYLNTYFRLGGEGYFSSCQYGATKNSCRIGWGGVHFDGVFPVKKWAPFAGITIGGGNITHFICIEKPQNNKKAFSTVFFKNPLCIINPAIGADFYVSNRISLLFKIDYMFSIYKPEPSYPQGFRFYFGVHFYHKN